MRKAIVPSENGAPDPLTLANKLRSLHICSKEVHESKNYFPHDDNTVGETLHGFWRMKPFFRYMRNKFSKDTVGKEWKRTHHSAPRRATWTQRVAFMQTSRLLQGRRTSLYGDTYKSWDTAVEEGEGEPMAWPQTRAQRKPISRDVKPHYIGRDPEAYYALRRQKKKKNTNKIRRRTVTANSRALPWRRLQSFLQNAPGERTRGEKGRNELVSAI